MLKTTIVLLMTLCLSACQTTYEQKLVCAQIKEHQIKPIRNCDISVKLNRCRCRCFDMNSWSALKLNQCQEFPGYEGTVYNFELDYCEGISGFPLDQIATNVRPQVKALDRIKNNLCN